MSCIILIFPACLGLFFRRNNAPVAPSTSEGAQVVHFDSCHLVDFLFRNPNIFK